MYTLSTHPNPTMISQARTQKPRTTPAKHPPGAWLLNRDSTCRGGARVAAQVTEVDTSAPVGLQKPVFRRADHAHLVEIKPGKEAGYFGPTFTLDEVEKHYALPKPDFPTLFVTEPKQGISPKLHAAVIREALHASLVSGGATILRGLNYAEPGDYRTLACELGFVPGDYERLHIDRALEDGLYDVTTSPGDTLLGPHNENVFNTRQPDMIMFICLQPAHIGGETLLLRNSDMTKNVGPEALSYFQDARSGVTYERWYPTQAQLDASDSRFKDLIPTWQAFTNATTRAGAEDYFSKRNLTVRWDEEGGIYASNQAPAVRPDPMTGEPAWFNFVTDNGGNPPFFNIYDGHGKRLQYSDDPEMFAKARTARFQPDTVAVKLQKGDMIIIDNKRTMHGRNTFIDNENPRTMRTILADRGEALKWVSSSRPAVHR